MPIMPLFENVLKHTCAPIGWGGMGFPGEMHMEVHQWVSDGFDGETSMKTRSLEMVLKGSCRWFLCCVFCSSLDTSCRNSFGKTHHSFGGGEGGGICALNLREAHLKCLEGMLS